ncbi:MAG: hypothetical protein R2795_12135 [Saprospiraceae bacterium]
MPSSSVGVHTSLFEPIHGSYSRRPQGRIEPTHWRPFYPLPCC